MGVISHLYILRTDPVGAAKKAPQRTVGSNTPIHTIRPKPQKILPEKQQN